MEKNIINENSDEILCYRLRTARHKMRVAKKSFNKKLLQLDKENRQIRKQQRELGFIDLTPPVRNGWKRYFVLRDDVARSKYALLYQGILDKINTTVYCSRRDFKKRSRFSRKGRNWNPIEQTVVYPGHQELIKMKFTVKELALFEERYVRHKYRKKVWVKVWVFKEQWRFVFRTRPHFITKVKAVDSTLESRSKAIDNYLGKNDLDGKLSRLRGHSVSAWRRSNGEKLKYRFEKMPLRDMISVIAEE